MKPPSLMKKMYLSRHTLTHSLTPTPNRGQNTTPADSGIARASIHQATCRTVDRRAHSSGTLQHRRPARPPSPARYDDCSAHDPATQQLHTLLVRQAWERSCPQRYLYTLPRLFPVGRAHARDVMRNTGTGRPKW